MQLEIEATTADDRGIDSVHVICRAKQDQPIDVLGPVDLLKQPIHDTAHVGRIEFSRVSLREAIQLVDEEHRRSDLFCLCEGPVQRGQHIALMPVLLTVRE